ncbi:DUF3093 domain-containing protein [Salinibacterium sp. G-O1]|uniref:DUF3093 domain-containing protein n=1 Tax=Salinibacterium sp. G-O1 TaxID=3046208 RepID=UPI0024B98A4F|nr:DUF3093 domain-containing protein [Salinibacterium sp. G-O1]MDJ0335244.1 DUF3093 domain-containing protein [Salinibacterium sp. G-O1]
MTNYREKLWPAPWLFISTALVIPASLLVFLPININVGIGAAVVLYLGCLAALLASATKVEVTETHLIAGKARLPLDIIGAVDGFVGSEATLERGQRLDARAFLVIRGWIDPVVRVELIDPNDPVPYWLVSTRKPQEVSRAIDQARSALKN